MPGDWTTELPVYRRIERSLRQFITDNRLAAHARLPSESELAREHQASIGTVRKALNNLVAAKIIYRRHGQGTFVSPRGRKGRVLLVPPHEGLSDVPGDDYFEFLVGALAEANKADLLCEPALVECVDFLHNAAEARMIYPEIAGVIFFRGRPNLMQTAADLERQRIPFLYYGPNIYGADRDETFSTMYHNEWTIAEMLAELAAERRARRVAIIGRESDIDQARLERLGARLQRRGIGHDSVPTDLLHGDPADFGAAVAGHDLLIGTISVDAMRAVQILERDLGGRVPRDLEVAGVDNPPASEMLRPALTVVDLCNRRNGRTAIRQFAERLATGDRRPFHLDSELSLLRRETC